MPRPPSPTQRTYRGKIRSDMWSSFHHLAKLIAWNERYLAGPSTNYPNQLYVSANATIITGCASLLVSLLASKGPIPLIRS
jgi:hypothetical protein